MQASAAAGAEDDASELARLRCDNRALRAALGALARMPAPPPAPPAPPPAPPAAAASAPAAAASWADPAGHGLSAEQLGRYARHVALPAFGAAGQGALARARVLLVGAGGLGSAAAFYLAAAGVGTLAIADSDVVEASNLHRQIIHTQARARAACLGSLAGKRWLRMSQPCCPFADAARAPRGALRRRAWAPPRRRPPPRRAAR